MKNTLLLSLGVLLSAGTLLTACSSDDGASDGSPAGSVWTLTVKATKGGNEASTRALSESPNPETGKSTIAAKWSTTERVHVYSNKAPGEIYLGFLHPDANKATANLKGSLKTETEIADDYYTGLANTDLTLQFPKAGQISYSGQNGTLENISSDYDWAIATVRIDRIDLSTKTIIPTPDVASNFVNQQAIVKFTLKDNAGNSLNASSLKISALGLIDYGEHHGDVEINPEGATNVIWAALRGINGTVTLTATTVDEGTYTYTTKEPKTFENGKYYDITVKMTQKP